MKNLRILLLNQVRALRRTSLRSGGILLIGVLLCGCRGRAAHEQAGEPAGTYTLASVNGQAVPARVSHDGASLQVRSGTFTVSADGTCGTRTVFLPPSGSETVREVSATWTREGSRLTMKWKGAGITRATLTGNTLTMDNEGMVFVYRK